MEIEFFLTLNTDVTIKKAKLPATPPSPYRPTQLLCFSKQKHLLATDYSFAFDGMFTNSMGYDQDHRPTKRPRDNGGGESAHHPTLSINPGLAMENMGMGMGSMGMSATGDSLKNTREGRQQQQQQQQQQVSTSPTTTTGNRGRTDDKNNRKLSCKECRRRVAFFFLP